MISITIVETIDEEACDYVRCPQCRSKIGWKPKNTKVRVYPLPQAAAIKPEQMGFTCKRCKGCFLIATV